MLMYEADQNSVGGSHQCMLKTLPLEILRLLANPQVRS